MSVFSPFGSAWRQVFASRRMAAMLGLGFASGLPLALSAGTLQAWLTVSGVDLTTIGFFALVGLPYSLKFIWAPLLDRFEPRWCGRRRSWLLFTQLSMAAVCVAMAQSAPEQSLTRLAFCAVLLAVLSASQDIVFDAYRADVLPAHERGAGAAVSVLGYRLAMLVSGGLAMVLADQWLGWPQTYRLMGVLLVAAAALTVWAPDVPALTAPVRTAARQEWRGFVAMVAAAAMVWSLAAWAVRHSVPIVAGPGLLWVGETVAVGLAGLAGVGAARWAGFPSFMQPWDAFFARPQARALLALIVFYKLGDAFAGSLTTAFLIRSVGFSVTEVGAVNKALGLVATVLGALMGGALLLRMRLWRALWWFGVLQALSNLGYWLLAVAPKSYGLMALAIGLENVCGGLGTAAFVAFLMSLTDARFTAAQYALLSALAVLGRVYVGPASGFLVAALGWPGFFLLTVGAAVPGLVLLAVLRPTIHALEPPSGDHDAQPAR